MPEVADAATFVSDGGRASVTTTFGAATDRYCDREGMTTFPP